MPACVVKHCKNNSSIVYSGDKKITFHRFPKDKPTRQKWIDILRVSRGEPEWKASDFCLICSEHFTEGSRYATKRGINFIRKNALPTENLESPIVKIEVEVPPTGENGNERENNNVTNTDVHSDCKRESPTPICDIESALSLGDEDLPDIDCLVDSPLSYSDIDLSELCSDVLSPMSQSDTDESVPLWEIEPSVVNWGDTDKLIPHLEIESTDFSEMDTRECRKLNPQHPHINYVLIRPPSQDPDVQYLEICWKRELRKYMEYKKLWRHKLELYRLRIWRLTRSNASLNLKLANR